MLSMRPFDRLFESPPWLEARPRHLIPPPGTIQQGRITMRPLLFALRDFEVSPLTGDVRLTVNVLDRETAEPIDLRFGITGGRWPVETQEQAELLRRALLLMFAHEIDELLFVDDRRRHDPHPPVRFPVTLGVDPAG